MGMANSMEMMNQMGMMNNQPNLMNLDATSQNIKNIIEPYENKIRELEEIIRQKDFEIIVLKQKLNNSNNMNINQNMMNMNLMNMMLGNMNNLNQQIKNREIIVNLQLKNKEIISVKCFENDTISELEKKCKINKGCLSYDYRIIYGTSTIKEKGIMNGSTIKLVLKDPINITFQASWGKNVRCILDGDCPVGMIIILFFFDTKRSDMLMDEIQKNRYSFLYNAMKINIKDTTPITDYFQGNLIPRIIVNDNFGLIGG